MIVDRWGEVERLLHQAMQLAPEERGAFLASIESGDVRGEVASLLASGSDRGTSSIGATIGDAAAAALDEQLTGRVIAHFRILRSLGHGAMGEVYLAQDEKLGRQVALKLLPAVFLTDNERVHRFEREARAAAALNHPNIVTVHEVGEWEGQPFIATEFVEGETLAQRLSRRPLSMAEALPVGGQIADALAAAHDAGIVHRDLKPGNIMLRSDGTVKVLDFGLARLLRPPVEFSAAEGETETPTLSGRIMGTLNYMAPEQARGKPVDKRADIFSFGVVLYEMLTGKQLFAGETVSDTLAQALSKEPEWEQVPPNVRRLLQRCLEKDPKKRLRDIGDAMPLLEDGPAASNQPKSKLSWAVAVGLGLALIVLGVLLWRAMRPVEPNPLTRLSVDLGPDATTGLNLTAAISPDGRRLVFPARGPGGKQQLATRLLDQPQATLLPGTENGRDPFFSPDGQWLGFFADSKLKKISVEGGAPVTLCDAPLDYGASWAEEGTIIAALNLLSGLSRVPAAGGTPEPLTRLGKGEVTHRWPQVLPGGQTILFTASLTSIAMENASVEAMSLKSGVTKTLVAGGYFGRYLPANGSRGYLVYLHQSVLSGVGFDPIRLEVQGTPVPLLEDVAASPFQGGGQFDFSAAPSGHGTLMYLAGKGAAQTWPLAWLDSFGKMQPLISTPGAYVYPRFSPDGRRLALTLSTSSGTDIYVCELERGTMTRLTFGGTAEVPVWTPDGKHIAFRSTANGYGIWWVRSDGSGEAQQILELPNYIVPWSISPDGRRLVYSESKSETGYDIWTIGLDTSDPDHPKAVKPEPFLATPSDENVPIFSPDGRWITYRSNESGTYEIYVRPFPGGRGGGWQISAGGGLYGIWSNNGRELFYETADHRIMVVDYAVNGDSFVPGKPRLWSGKQIFYTGQLNLALAPDGKRFAVFPMPEGVEPEKGSIHVTFLQNFLDELRRRIPPGR